MTNVLLIGNDIVGPRMAGPGIRYWEMRQALARRFEALLAIPPFLADKITISSPPPWLHLCHTSAELRREVERADVIITLGIVPWLYPFIPKAGKPLVIDLYDPFLLEELQRQPSSDEAASLTYERYLEALWSQLRAGDFFICAGEKQRDYWLGMLSAVGRLNPYTYQDDPSFYRLIDIVPFGIPSTPPQHHRRVLKGVHPAIAAEDRLLLWGGGLWEWFDPLTLIRALPRVLSQRSDVKLFFMGIRRPNHPERPSSVVSQALALSQSLGLKGRYVLFNDWVPYEARQDYLMEADIGVSLHLDRIESRFAFRTRLLDYLWAGLPILATEGDVLGEQLAAQGLAQLVAPGDVEGVAQAILCLLQEPLSPQAREARIREAVQHYRWDKVIEPLADFCAAPRFAADKGYFPSVAAAGRRWGWQQRLRKGWRLIREGGVRAILKEAGAYLQWRRSQK